MNEHRTASAILLTILLLTFGGYGWCRLGHGDNSCGTVPLIGGATFSAAIWLFMLIGFTRSLAKKKGRSDPPQ